MVKISIKTSLDEDIISLLNEDSIIRSAFKGTISLANYNLPLFQADESYTSLNIQIEEDKDTLDYQQEITTICQEGRHTGKHEKFHTAVSEAVRNAYQHGNGKDSNKKINLSYKVTDKTFEVVVSDEGGEINADFFPFILLHRQGNLLRPVNFYEFSGKAVKSMENSGIGTYVIHMVADEVNYYKNNAGGLSVQMIIRKE